jgi:Cu/Ag efflux protein CusF
MRQLIAALLTTGLLVAMVAPVVAQDKAATKPSKLATRTVKGTVKSTTADAIVVRGIEKEKEREWAFSVDNNTTVRKGNQSASAAQLKEGDSVTVNYTERDGKIIAQSVTVTDGGGPSTPPVRSPSSKPAPSK